MTKDEKHALGRRIKHTLATSSPPYSNTVGGAFLDRAWQRGAEHMVAECLSILAQIPEPAPEAPPEENLARQMMHRWRGVMRRWRFSDRLADSEPRT